MRRWTTERDAGGPAVWTAVALLAVTPFAVDPDGLVPTGPLRWTVLTTVSALALVVASARGPRTAPAVPPAARTAALFLLVWLTAAAVAGLDPLHAWIGTPDRRMGMLAWYGLAVWAVVGARISRSNNGPRTVSRAAGAAGVGLGLWTAAELAGHPPLGLAFADGRTGGPYGQPAYLSAAALIALALAASHALNRAEHRAWRALAAVGAVGGLVAVVASQTRGAWVGAAVATSAAALRQRGRLRVSYKRRARRAVRRGWKLATPLAAVVVGVVLVVATALTPLGDRALSTFDLGSGTSRGRLDEWRVASRVVVDRPLLGAGPEGYRIAFGTAVDAGYVRRHGLDVIPDRAHNALADVAATGGVPAALAYLALLALAIGAAWRSLAGGSGYQRAAGWAVIAFAVQQQFLFPLAEVDPLFWLVGGMALATNRQTGDAPARPRSADRWALGERLGPAARRWARGAAAVVGTGAALIAVVAGGREVAADRALLRATSATDADRAAADARRATELRPDSIRAWYVAASLARRGEALTDVDRALAALESGLGVSPGDPALRVAHADLLVARAERSGLAEDAVTAEEHIERYLQGSPNHPRLLSDRAVLLARRGDQVGALAALARAEDLDPGDERIAAIRQRLSPT